VNRNRLLGRKREIPSRKVIFPTQREGGTSSLGRRRGGRRVLREIVKRVGIITGKAVEKGEGGSLYIPFITGGRRGRAKGRPRRKGGRSSQKKKY